MDPDAAESAVDAALPQAQTTPPDASAQDRPAKEAPEMVDREAAERILRTETAHGLTSDFVEARPQLAQIYEAVRRTSLLAFEKQDGDLPDFAELYATYAQDRRALGDRNILDEESVRQRLMMLVGQDVPFIMPIREPALNEQGRPGVFTRYISPTTTKRDRVMRALEASVRRSFLWIKDLRTKPPNWTAWGDAINKANSGLVPDRAEIIRERIDALLAGLRFRAVGQEGLARQHIQRANQLVSQWQIKPLLQLCGQSGLIQVISCADLRERSRSFSHRNDIIYFANDDYLDRRLQQIRRLMLTSVFEAHVDPGLYESAKLDPSPAKVTGLAESAIERLAQQPEAPPVLLDIALEAARLPKLIQTFQKQADLRQAIEELQAAVDQIRKHGTLMLIGGRDRLRFGESVVRRLLAGEARIIRTCLYPFASYSKSDPLSIYEGIYALHMAPENVSRSVDATIALFEKSGDDHLLFVLERVLEVDRKQDAELKRTIPPVTLFRLHEALKRAYARKLPFWQRLIHTIFGSELSEKRLAEARGRVQSEGLVRIQRARSQREAAEKERAQDAVRARARENIDREKQSTGTTTAGVAGADESGRQAADLSLFVDEAWESGRYPTVQMVVAACGSAAELRLDRPEEFAQLEVSGREPVVIRREYLEANRRRLIATLEKRSDEADQLLRREGHVSAAGQAAKRNYLLTSGLLRAITDAR